MRKLFETIKMGPYQLTHRVVLAPLTRMRTDAGDVPSDKMVEYYIQRSTPGGFLISEATCVTPKGVAYAGAPGIFTDAQEEGWKKVTKAVHDEGGIIFLQLWHGGRQAHPDNMNGLQPVAPSALRAREKAAVLDDNGSVMEVDQVRPRALGIEEIPGVIAEFREAAVRAMRAGFDGVELHSANGYLTDQFLQDGSNHRQDAYGGSVENRARLLIEVVEALTDVWGKGRVGVRISPSGTFGTMHDSDPAATFGYVAEKMNAFDLAYLHIVEPRIRGYEDLIEDAPAVASKNLRNIYKGMIIAAGGFTGESAEEILAAGHADMVAFGRHFISNPDLPERLRQGAPLTPYDRTTFYGGDEKGYTDYPFMDASPFA